MAGLELLNMSGIRKAYGPTRALDGVDFSINAGEIHALVGENGAGKSTLMKVLSGAERHDRGEITFAGNPYSPRGPLDARRLGVAMIYQELSLAEHLTVEQNISLGVEPERLGFVRLAPAREQAGKALAELGHYDIPLSAIASSLPISARQIVEIARAVAHGCRVLVLDEPTSSLSMKDAGNLFALVRRLRDSGHGIVYISHFLEEVVEIADRVTVLRDGKTVGTRDIAETETSEMVAMMVGRRVEDLYPRTDHIAGEAILDVSGLSGRPLPEFAGLTLHRGEVLGIAGLVGSGRTELLRAVFGLAPVRSGSVRVAGVASAMTPHDMLNRGVGMLSEDRKDEGLAVSLPVEDNITLSNLRGLGPRGFVLPGRRRTAAERWIRELGIRCSGTGQPVEGLSGGNQQKAALARLLHHDVDVLLLDEPTRGIDVASKAQIYELINRLAAGDAAVGRKPKALLVVSSYLPELLGVCDRIAVMCRGCLGRPRNVSEWTEHELLQEATGQAA